MPRGQPDFGIYAPKEVTVGLSDLGELAVRLGSIVIYDRRGDVVDFDTFEESLLRWSISIGLTGEYCRLDSTNAKSGSQTIKLHTIASSLSLVSMSRGISLRGSTRIGIEISFSALSGVCELIGGAAYYDGDDVHYARWKLVPSLEKLYIYDDTARDYVEIADVGAVMSAAFIFYTIKIVFDISTKKYVRLLFADTEYDISSYTLYAADDDTAPRVVSHFFLVGSAADAGNVWFDDYIITQNEP